MAQNSIIGIGGTGAKCLEAITYLSASGLDYFNNQGLNNEVFALLVDPDSNNGNLERTELAIKNYSEFRKIANQNGQKEFFKTKISYLNDNQSSWSPINSDADVNTLDDIFLYNNLGNYQSIYDILFTNFEKSQNLDNGFRGHPSIGASVISKGLNLNVGVWNDLKTKIVKNIVNSEFRLLLVGSIFGGTGAAGFPVIARRIKQEIGTSKNFKIGGILLLPYFGFESINESEDNRASQNKELAAKANEFLYSSKIALQYYKNQKFNNIFDQLYIIGDNKIKNEAYNIGAKNQENDANLVEIYAALAASDFFTKEKLDGSCNVSIIERNYENIISWNDFPGQINGNFYKDINKFTRFSVFYLSMIHPYLDSITKKTNKRSPISWYRDYFRYFDTNMNLDNYLKGIKDFCDNYLIWLKQIHKHPDYNVALLNKDSLDYYKEDNNYKKSLDDAKRSFDNLVKTLKIVNSATPETTVDHRSKSLRNIWDGISVRDSNFITQDILDGFLQKLYEVC